MFKKGQILLELLIALALSAIIFVGLGELVFSSRKTSSNVAKEQGALYLLQETFEVLKSLRDSNWHNLYDLNKDQEYYLKRQSSGWSISGDSNDKIVSLNGIDYERYFVIQRVSRNANGEIVETGGKEDPSTLKVKVFIKANGMDDLVMSRYFTRFKNDVFVQTDWSGGPGQPGPITIPNNRYFWDDGNLDATGLPGSVKLKTY